MSSPLAISALHQVALPCSELARSIDFYRDVLGLPLIAQFAPPGLAFFALGNTRLLVDATGEAKQAAGVLYLRVGDILAAAGELRARGVALEGEPHCVFPDARGTFGAAGEEEWVALFRDPDGNLLALAARARPRPAA